MEELFKKTLVMILCGGKGERLYPLTKDRSKPSVPFLGSYRIIDFSLSNSLNSGFRKIALLTQYKSLSLERHILYGWNIFHAESGGYIISLPAQGRVADHWYEGTADAVFQNFYTIQHENPEAVFVLSGDHVYKADYRKIFKFFFEKNADAVLLAKTVDHNEASRFGIIGIDKDNRIQEFIEKPRKPLSVPWNPALSLISMGVYLFKTPVLIRSLIRDAKNSKSTHDFGKDVIPRMIHRHHVYAYPFEGYWEDIGTIDAYWKANMAFLSNTPPFRLQEDSWPVRTYKAQYPPSFIQSSDIQNSIVSCGCTISGGILRDSIISSGVNIEKKATIKESILLEGAHVGKGARLQRVIVDKFSRIPENFEIGYDRRRDGKNFMISPEGIRVVPRHWRVE